MLNSFEIGFAVLVHAKAERSPPAVEPPLKLWIQPFVSEEKANSRTFILQPESRHMKRRRIAIKLKQPLLRG